MKKRIVYTRPNGAMAVLVPAPNARRRTSVRPQLDHCFAADKDGEREPKDTALAEGRYETDEEFIERIRLKDVPLDAIGVVVIDAAMLPGDRTFRDAWKHDALGVVSVDMSKARELHRQRIRKARKPMLAALDVAFMRALGRRDDAEADAVEAQRQVLRDALASPAIDEAGNPDELKAAWPLPSLVES